MEIFRKGGGGPTQSITTIHIWYTRCQMCITGSITPENKGGGSDPLWNISISKPLFFLEGFPNTIGMHVVFIKQMVICAQ